MLLCTAGPRVRDPFEEPETSFLYYWLRGRTLSIRRLDPRRPRRRLSLLPEQTRRTPSGRVFLDLGSPGTGSSEGFVLAAIRARLFRAPETKSASSFCVGGPSPVRFLVSYALRAIGRADRPQGRTSASAGRGESRDRDRERPDSRAGSAVPAAMVSSTCLAGDRLADGAPRESCSRSQATSFAKGKLMASTNGKAAPRFGKTRCASVRDSSGVGKTCARGSFRAGPFELHKDANPDELVPGFDARRSRRLPRPA